MSRRLIVTVIAAFAAISIIGPSLASPAPSPEVASDYTAGASAYPLEVRGADEAQMYQAVDFEAGAPLDSYSWVNASTFDSLGSVEERVELVGAIANADYRESGCLASVTAAQMILESGVLSGNTSGLAANYNNYFGIKGDPEDSTTWRGSTWTGQTAFLGTQEQDELTGVLYDVGSAFRVYTDIVDSVRDHSSYLAFATWDGTVEIYPGYEEIRDYREAAELVGTYYATGWDYAADIISIIEQYDLTRFDTLD